MSNSLNHFSGLNLSAPRPGKDSAQPQKVDSQSQTGHLDIKCANAKSYNRKTASRKKNAATFQEKKSAKTWSNQTRKTYLRQLVKNSKLGKSEFDPHTGIIIPSLDELSKLQGEAHNIFGKSSKVWSKIESAILTCHALSCCTSEEQGMSILLLSIKSLYSDVSLCTKAIDMFKEILRPEIDEPQSSGSKPLWLEAFTLAFSNWKLCTNHLIFKKMSIIISALVTLGLCDAANFEWNFRDVKIFSATTHTKHLNALDLIDAVLESVTYFIESGYECYRTGSLSPLLFSDNDAHTTTQDYHCLIANLDHVKNGNLRKFANMDSNDYSALLDKTIKKLSEMSRRAPFFEKTALTRMLENLLKSKTIFDAVRVGGGLRIAPFSISISGPTATGKSGIASISMNLVLDANGFDSSPERIQNINSNDKFESNMKSDTNGVNFDDMANTNPKFAQLSPTDTIIKYINNQRMYANMADLAQKGSVSIEPKMFIATTNVKHLDASVYSNDPASILRRFNIHVSAKVRERFCMNTFAGFVQQQMDASKVHAFYTHDGILDMPHLPDLWEFTCETCVPVPSTIPGVKDTITFVPIVFEGCAMVDVNIEVYVRLLVHMSGQHFKNQEAFVARNNAMKDTIQLCPKCRVPTCFSCVCPPPSEPEPEPHIGISTVGVVLGTAANLAIARITEKVTQAAMREAESLENMATKKLCQFTRKLETNYIYLWTNFVPDSWLRNQYTRPIVQYYMDRSIKEQSMKNLGIFLFFSFFFLLYSMIFHQIFIFPCIFIFLYIAIIYKIIKERMYNELLRRRDALPEICKTARDTFLTTAIAALGVAGMLYGVIKVYQGVKRSLLTPQGNLTPSTPEEVESRDAQPNDWLKLHKTDTPRDQKQSAQTWEEANARVGKNLVHVAVTRGDSTFTVNGFFLHSNVMIIPEHFWFENSDAAEGNPFETMVATITRRDANNVGNKFKTFLSRKTSEKIRDTDLSVVSVANAGTFQDLRWMVQLHKGKPGQASMIHRGKDGLIQVINADLNPGNSRHRTAEFYGGISYLSTPSEGGMCCSVYVTKDVDRAIAGLHLGGITGTPKGCYTLLDLEAYSEAVERLMTNNSSILRCASAGTLKIVQYDKNILTSGPTDPRDPGNFLTGETNLNCYGSCIGRSSFSSEVVQSIISKSVEIHCGIPNKWGCPMGLRTSYPWQDFLKVAANPAIGIEGHLLELAVDDYLEPILHNIRTHEHFRKYLRPLTRMETICGIDGVRFIDGIKSNTSIGFPLAGPKIDHMQFFDPEDYPGFSCPADIAEKFWEETEEMKLEYLAGRVTYPIFATRPKDEPTANGKKRVRMFQAAPIALQLLVRQYFLPIARYICLDPLTTESAVGINAHGPEWHEMNEHITQHGNDRIFAGDYSKYDLTMSAQVNAASLRCFIEMAIASGNYDEDHIKIMEGLSTDIISCCIALNGTLYQLFGINPSGHPMTVFSNNNNNSLLQRSHYYHIKPKESNLTYREVVSIINYGDDVKGSVKIGHDYFNIKSYAAFLKDRGMLFTMPDKSQDLVPYMHDKNCDFLKRHNVWNDELQINMAALAEDSIFKSLHSNLKSKSETAENVAVSTITGGLIEFFFHGKDVYENRRTELKEVASEHNLVVKQLGISYEEQMLRWREKYLSPTPLS